MSGMPEVVTLTSLQVDPAHQARLLELTQQTKVRFENLPGCKSYAFWRDPAKSGAFLLTVHYESVEASLRGYETWGTSPQMFDIYAILLDAPDVHRLIVDQTLGASPADVPLGGTISVSHRVADTGHGFALAEELQRIFGELTVLEGFMGGIVGHREQLEEEVSGLALWASAEAFEASMPKRTLYEVRAYSRVM